MQYSMDISATTIALQRSGLVEPIRKETRQFAKPIWEKKNKKTTKSPLSNRKLRPDTKEKNRDAHGITSSHCYDHVQYRNKTENDGKCCFHTKITPNAEPKTRQDCALVTPKKKAGTHSASKSSSTLWQATPILHQHVPK